MNGTKAILDSNAIIFASKKIIDVEKLLSKYDEFYVSVITYIEVYSFDFQNATEKDITDDIFANLEIIEISREIADRAINLPQKQNQKDKTPRRRNFSDCEIC